VFAKVIKIGQRLVKLRLKISGIFMRHNVHDKFVNEFIVIIFRISIRVWQSQSKDVVKKMCTNRLIPNLHCSH